MSRLTLEHIEHINKGDYLKPVLKEKDAFQVAGIMTLVKDDPEVILQLWEPKSGQGLAGPFEIEYYGQDFRRSVSSTPAPSQRGPGRSGRTPW
jgi:hypothetical protein